MARRPKCWQWSTGSRGARVRVAERVPGGPLYVMVPHQRPNGSWGWRKVSLGHRDKERAMAEAAQLSARRQSGDTPLGPLTVATLFEVYLRSVEGKHSPSHARETRRITKLWTAYLGGSFDVTKFGPAQWDAFARLRATGELGASGKRVTDPEKQEPVRSRTIAKELKVLRAACRRATIERTSSGAFLLLADPTRGLTLPVEKNPRRPICESDRFDQLLAVADRVQMRIGFGEKAKWEPSYLPTLLRLAGDTGRRISSILALRWSDWQAERGTYGMLRWRAEEDKVGREWWAPVTPEVRDELERVRRLRPGVGDALLFPAPNKPAEPVSVQVATNWLRQAEKLAKLERLEGGAWHPFRRRWATARKHLSPKDVAAVGGWIDTTTLQRVYQAPDLETMEAVVLQPKRVQRVIA